MKCLGLPSWIVPLLCIFFSLDQVHADWNVAIDKKSKPLSIYVNEKRLEVIGEIRGEQIGVESRGGQQYGIQGGGLASALIMLAAHAAVVQGQRSEQEEKVWQEGRLFGKALTEKLKSKTTGQIFFVATNESSEFEGSVHPSPAEGNQRLTNSAEVELDIWSSRDYRALMVNLSFKEHPSSKDFFRVTVSTNREFPFVDDEGRVLSSFDVDQELTLLIQEALRIYARRSQWSELKSKQESTIRSKVGDEKRFERGFLIAKTCDRHLFEDLSGVWVARNRIDKDTDSPLCKASPLTIIR